MKAGVESIAGTEYNEYYSAYVAKGKILAKEMDLLQHGSGLVRFLKEIPEEKHGFRYDVGKWSIKEIIGHIIDTERVFAFRALAFARGEKNPIPGFDQDEYQKRSNAHHRSMDELLEEMISVRVSTHHMFESFDESMMKMIGNASGNDMSVRAIYLITYGHAMHHIAVIKERYL